MLSILHTELEDYFISAIGLEKWKEVLRLSGLVDTSSPASSSYPAARGDEALFHTIAAVCQVTGADQHQLLAGFGRYFINSLSDQGYDRVREGSFAPGKCATGWVE